MDPTVLLRSPRRGRAYAAAAGAGAVASSASWVVTEHDARLVLLPVATLVWFGQWLLLRRNGVVLGAGWLEVRSSGLRRERIAWGDVIEVQDEPWLSGRRLRLWTPDGTTRTPVLSSDDLSTVLRAYDRSRGVPPVAGSLPS